MGLDEKAKYHSILHRRLLDGAPLNQTLWLKKAHILMEYRLPHSFWVRNLYEYTHNQFLQGNGMEIHVSLLVFEPCAVNHF